MVAKEATFTHRERCKIVVCECVVTCMLCAFWSGQHRGVQTQLRQWSFTKARMFISVPVSTSTRGGQNLPWSSTASGAGWFCACVWCALGNILKTVCMAMQHHATPASTVCLLERFSRQAPSRLHILQQPLNSKGVHASKSHVLGPWARGERGGQENCVRRCVR